MEWISIEDRFPPQGVYVLIAKFDHREKVKMYFIDIAENIGQYWYEGKDGEEITQGGKYGRVTHWMPLPNPPEPKKESGLFHHCIKDDSQCFGIEGKLIFDKKCEYPIVVSCCPLCNYNSHNMEWISIKNRFPQLPEIKDE